MSTTLKREANIMDIDDYNKLVEISKADPTLHLLIVSNAVIETDRVLLVMSDDENDKFETLLGDLLVDEIMAGGGPDEVVSDNATFIEYVFDTRAHNDNWTYYEK